jgi:integrating conjugative element protein (TIGR03752 family)
LFLIVFKVFKLAPVYTIPNNSILSGKLITGLIGRIPLDGQLTDPFRFSIKIIKKSFYANRHVNNVLQDVIASGTASGDLRLSCVRASIDSITFIFEDGSVTSSSAIGSLTMPLSSFKFCLVCLSIISTTLGAGLPPCALHDTVRS